MPTDPPPLLGFKTKPCECGKPMLFAQGTRNTSGGVKEVWIPLDPKAPVYRLVKGPDGKPHAERLEDAFVTHFATCAKANKF